MIIHYLLFPLAPAPDVGISGWGQLWVGAAYENAAQGQTWNLSKILHDQIFQPEILHTIFIYDETTQMH